MKKLVLLLLVFANSQLFSQSWTQTLNGITIWSLAKDMNSNIYAGSTGSNSKIFRSSNLGVNWDTVSGANGQTVFSMDFDSLGRMFVANSTAGLLRSTNGGVSFTVIPESVFGNSGLQAVACGKNGYVYVATNGAGFYRSTDTGSTFTQTGLSSMQVVALLVDKYNPSMVYAGVSQTYAGFYRSTDFGATFSANLNPGKNIFGIMESSPSVLYTVTTSPAGAVDKSTDGGLTWNTTASGYVCRGIANSPFGILIAGNGGLFISTNGGTSFSNYGITAISTPVLSIGNVTIVGASGTTAGGAYYNVGIVGLNNNGTIAQSFQLYQNYPNPFNPSTKIKFDLPSSGQNLAFVTRIDIYDALGKKMETLFSRQLQPGSYEFEWNAANYPSGVYYYKLSYGVQIETKKMVLIK